MKVLIIQVDKTQDSYISEGVEVFLKRLKNYTQHSIITINVPKNLRQRSIPEQKTGEGELVQKQINADDYLVLLDEGGTELTSQEFASFLSKRMQASAKRVVFVIGGPFGFSEEMYRRADFKLSLSRMTFSHQMVRLFFAEQLYRAFTILRGEKYHHL